MLLSYCYDFINVTEFQHWYKATFFQNWPDQIIEIIEIVLDK